MGIIDESQDRRASFIEDKASAEILWSLVADGCSNTCVSLFGETPKAREQRLAGEMELDGKEVLRQLDDELNRFINKNREAGGHDMLITLVAAVMYEAAMLEASKIRERQAKSSIS